MNSMDELKNADTYLNEGRVDDALACYGRVLEDRDNEMRRAGVDALIAALYMHGDPAIPQLIQALENEDKEICIRAADALGTLANATAVVPPLIQAFRHNDEEVRIAVSRALLDIGEQAVEPLIQALEDGDRHIRCGAAMTLGPFAHMLSEETRAVEPLIGALRDEDAIVRASAAFALGQSGDARAVSPLIETLGDEDEEVRRVTADSLEQLNKALR